MTHTETLTYAPFNPEGFSQIEARYEIQHNPDRKVIIRQLHDLHGLAEATPEAAQEQRAMLGELQDLGIAVAMTSLVVGQAENNKRAIYAVVEEIQGQQFDDKSVHIFTQSPEVKAQAHDLCWKLGGYLDSKLSKGEKYLSDIYRPSQYVFSKDKEEFVLTDVDPITQNADEYGAYEGLVRLCELSEFMIPTITSDKQMTEWIEFMDCTMHKIQEKHGSDVVSDEDISQFGEDAQFLYKNLHQLDEVR